MRPSLIDHEDELRTRTCVSHRRCGTRRVPCVSRAITSVSSSVQYAHGAGEARLQRETACVLSLRIEGGTSAPPAGAGWTLLKA
jgi:hypothetical protein